MEMKKITKRILSLALSVLLLAGVLPSAAAAGEQWSSEFMDADGFYRITNPDGGATLSVADLDKIITVDGLAFKDLNNNGALDLYEDWRLTPEKRAENLIDLLTADSPIAKIAPLMMASMHFSSVSGDLETTAGMFGATSIDLLDKGMRHMLNAASSAETEPQVAWMNAMQAYAEADADMLGIPVNVFSDPRSNAGATDFAYDGSTGSVSKWPGSLGFAATFNPSYTEQFGKMASQEYRALGITTALSPQIDLATEPRWSRVSGTYGESPELTADIAAAYTKGFQTTYTDGGLVWGSDSVATMLKHWPGDGSGEAGRESHSNVGKYAVYPGDNLADHLIPFAAALRGNKSATTYAASIMPSYSIGIDKNGNPLGGDARQYGSGVSPYKMEKTLYGTYDFGGYVCTDWMVAGSLSDDGDALIDSGGGTAWGTGHLEGGERVWAGLKVGVDMYGGLESVNAVKEAYNVAAGEIGKEKANAHFADSAYRIMLSAFRLGLFEDPYHCVSESKDLVGNASFNEVGYKVQKDSVVMLKNKGNVISKYTNKKTVYIPMAYTPETPSMWGAPTPASVDTVFDKTTAGNYFNVVTDSIKAGADTNNLTADDIVRRTDFSGVDFALVKVTSPQSSGDMFTGTGFDWDKRNVPGDTQQQSILGPVGHAYDPSQPLDNGYYPKTLQYGEYYADPKLVRSAPLGVDPAEEEQWIAAGEKAGMSRYYGGKSTIATNSDHLDLILDTARITDDLPVVVYVAADSAMVVNEFESKVSSILMGYGISDAAALEVISGKHEPSGLLPLQMPANMDTVETQLEDVPFDMNCHVDTQGNTYDFAFGLNWNGVINDGRTAKYAVSTGWTNPFTDVKTGDWFHDAVKYVNEKGLMVGTAADKFSPNMDLSRAMVVTLLYRLEGSESTAGYENPFTDVSSGAYYTDAVKWAYHNKLVTGYGDGIFGVNDNITRQDLSTILIRYAEYADIELSSTRDYTGFSDDNGIASYAINAVKELYKAGVINGKPGNVFDPAGSATRAEFATMLMNFLTKTK